MGMVSVNIYMIINVVFMIIGQIFVVLIECMKSILKINIHE